MGSNARDGVGAAGRWLVGGDGDVQNGIDGRLGTESPGCSPGTPAAAVAASCSLLPGQDLCLGGFVGALQGAFICASAVLKRNLYVDVARLRKRTQATNAKKRD